jgi:hypothetical protein
MGHRPSICLTAEVARAFKPLGPSAIPPMSSRAFIPVARSVSSGNAYAAGMRANLIRVFPGSSLVVGIGAHLAGDTDCI